MQRPSSQSRTERLAAAGKDVSSSCSSVMSLSIREGVERRGDSTRYYTVELPIDTVDYAQVMLCF